MGGKAEAKTDLPFMQAVSKKCLKEAIENCLENGLYYEDICKVFADTINNFKKEQKNGSKEGD